MNPDPSATLDHPAHPAPAPVNPAASDSAAHNVSQNAPEYAAASAHGQRPRKQQRGHHKDGNGGKRSGHARRGQNGQGGENAGGNANGNSSGNGNSGNHGSHNHNGNHGHNGNGHSGSQGRKHGKGGRYSKHGKGGNGNNGGNPDRANGSNGGGANREPSSNATAYENFKAAAGYTTPGSATSSAASYSDNPDLAAHPAAPDGSNMNGAKHGASHAHAPESSTPATPPAPPMPKLGRLHLDELHALTHARLIERAEAQSMRVNPDRTRHQLVMDLMKYHLTHGGELLAEGVMELDASNNNQALLRWPRFNFKPFPEDIAVPRNMIQRHGLLPGHLLSVRVRLPQGNKERWMVADQLLAIEGIPLERWVEPKPFDHLTALYPNRRITLENNITRTLTGRAIDLVTPLGYGQRALIVAPPRGGKTMMMKEIARAIRANSPDTHVILLLVDERPEEVTDFKRDVDADIYSSTFDENAQRHVQVAEIVIERAKRLVELGKNVVVMLDSITRLARGYNNMMPNKGRIMSGGVDAKALTKPKKFFGAARNVEEGGSLTIIATALVDTNSRMDEVIFEEFKGTGNMELHLARELVEKRVYPAIHILNSGTRHEELLYHADEFARVNLLRKQLAQMPPMEAMEQLVAQLKATKTNAELLLRGLR